MTSPARRHGLLGAAVALLGLVLLTLDVSVALLPAGGGGPVVREALSTTCHQRPERSFHVGEQPLATCARCVGLHASGFLGGILLLFAPGLVAGLRVPAFTLAMAGILPLVADALLGSVVDSWDHPWLRATTGACAGVAVLVAAVAGSRAAGRAPSVVRPAVLGGILAGIASALPVLSAVNCCFCALVVLGGVFAAWSLLEDGQAACSPARCAGAGALAGLVAAVITPVLEFGLHRLVFGAGALEAQLDEIVRSALATQAQPIAGLDEILREALAGAMLVDFNAWTLLRLIVGSASFAFFGMLGGLLVSTLRRRRAQLAGPPAAVLPGHADLSAGRGAARPDADVSEASVGDGVAAPAAGNEEPCESPSGDMPYDQLPRLPSDGDPPPR